MTRVLAKTVVAGGVVYPAGTPATEELEGRITNPVLWVGGEAEGDLGDLPVVPDDAHPNTVLLREVCEYLIEMHLVEPDVSVSDLLDRAVEVFGDAEPESDEAADAGAQGDAAADVAADPKPAVSYDDLKVSELKAEIERRNADRDPEGENYLSSDGNKGDLIAALKLDDQDTEGQS